VAGGEEKGGKGEGPALTLRSRGGNWGERLIPLEKHERKESKKERMILIPEGKEKMIRLTMRSGERREMVLTMPLR